jgi:hypothetical protein
MVVGDRRRVFAREFCLEARRLQRRADITLQGRPQRKRQVRVPGAQRLVGGRVCQPVKTVQPVRPPADDDQVREPGPQCADETRKYVEVINGRGLLG